MKIFKLELEELGGLCIGILVLAYMFNIHSIGMLVLFGAIAFGVIVFLTEVFEHESEHRGRKK